MDELLSFMEEDDFGGSDAEGELEVDPSIPDPSCRRMTGSPLKHRNSEAKEQQNVTFKDIFGSPDKRDLKELGLSQQKSAPVTKKFDLASGSPLQSSSSSVPFSRSQFQLSKAIREDSKVPYKPETGLIVMDPYSRIRLVKASISIYYDETMTPEAALKDRNLGLEYVNLATFPNWYRSKGKDQKNFWVSGVLVRKTAGVRKSAKGNDYSIWELCDLRDLDKKVTVFLFGSAASSSSNLGATPMGSVIDLTTPSIMQDASSGTIKFSVSNSTQVRFIAQAKDFGLCQATKKDGNKCTAVVNTWECSFCIHHASKELKKLNVGLSKGKGKSFGGGNRSKSFGEFGGGAGGGGWEGESQESLKKQGVFIADFGAKPVSSFGKSSQKVKVTSRPNLPPSSRMALQGGVNTMNKNQLKFGNAETITFVAKGKEDHPLLKQDKPAPVVRKPLDLNPHKTRHLTDKDRELLSMLEESKSGSGATTTQAIAEDQVQSQKKKKNKTDQSPATTAVCDLITTSIVSNPNAASRNFMQFLNLQHAPKDQQNDWNSSQKSSAVKPMTMCRAAVKSMEKALDFVKKNGPLQKTDPNATLASKKRKSLSQPAPGSSSKKRSHTQIDVEFDFDSDEFKKILNAKSAHDQELDEIQHEEYFGKLEKKEALENKLLNTFSIDTNAVMCRQCKYVALSQSEFCKEQMHQVRLVKARKRFFKCKDCGNRTMSLDRLPKRPCNNCNNSSWLVAPVGKERKGPTLPSEMLAVRGNEEKFIGSAGSKMFMHLEA